MHTNRQQLGFPHLSVLLQCGLCDGSCLFIHTGKFLSKLLDFGFALEFVKAFYIPAAELEYWCQTHAEYSTSQRVALVNQIAGAFGWSSTAKSELLAKLGSREML